MLQAYQFDPAVCADLQLLIQHGEIWRHHHDSHMTHDDANDRLVTVLQELFTYYKENSIHLPSVLQCTLAVL